MTTFISMRLCRQPSRLLISWALWSPTPRDGFMNPFPSDGRLRGKKVTVRSASANLRKGRWSATFAIRNITMPNETLKMSFWTSLINTRLNTTRDICGIDLCRPCGPQRISRGPPSTTLRSWLFHHGPSGLKESNYPRQALPHWGAASRSRRMRRVLRLISAAACCRSEYR